MAVLDVGHEFCGSQDTPCFTTVFLSKVTSQKVANLITKRRINVMKLNSERKLGSHCTTLTQSSSTQCSPQIATNPIGGGHPHVLSANVVAPYLSAAELELYYGKTAFKFIGHVDSTSLFLYPEQRGFVHLKMPLTALVSNLTAAMTHQVAKIHKIHLVSHVGKAEQASYFECHDCVACNLFTSVFAPILTAKAKEQQCRQVRHAKACHLKLDTLTGGLPGNISDCEDTCNFPPPPLTDKLTHRVISDFCTEASPAVLQKAGCAVCGHLTPGGNLSSLKAIKNQLHILEAEGVTGTN